MQVIPVVDIRFGQAVHALRGERHAYRPVSLPALGVGVGGAAEGVGDALALAQWYRSEFGFQQLYAADLDAIEGREPRRSLVRRIAESGMRIWLDAGVRTADEVRRVVDDGASRVVIGLETLSSYGALRGLVQAVGRERSVFSLDLWGGVPVTRDTRLGALSPTALARLAVAEGIPSLLVVDLACVGTGVGVDWPLIETLRRAEPELEIVAGGGIGGPDDLSRLAAAGADGALVASALHDGRIGARDITAAMRQSGHDCRGASGGQRASGERGAGRPI